MDVLLRCDFPEQLQLMGLERPEDEWVILRYMLLCMEHGWPVPSQFAEYIRPAD